MYVTTRDNGGMSWYCNVQILKDQGNVKSNLFTHFEENESVHSPWEFKKKEKPRLSSPLLSDQRSGQQQ